MLEAVLGRQQAADDDAAAGKRRRALGAAARNAAVVAEAYPESEAHAGIGADGEQGKQWAQRVLVHDTIRNCNRETVLTDSWRAVSR